GALADPEAARRTLFFERDAAWLDTLNHETRADFEEASEATRGKLANLKARIRDVATVRSYGAPADIGPAVEAALGELLETHFWRMPPPDASTRAHLLHAASARDRPRVHVGGEPYLEQLDRWMVEPGAPPLLVIGASGAGKSALIAHWLQA